MSNVDPILKDIGFGAVGAAGGGIAGAKIDDFRQKGVNLARVKARMKAYARWTAHQMKDRRARTEAMRNIFTAEMSGKDMSGYGYQRTPEFSKKYNAARDNFNKLKSPAKRVKPIALVSGALGGGLLGAFMDKKAEDNSTMIKKAEYIMEKLAAGGFLKLMGGVAKRLPALGGKLGPAVRQATNKRTLNQLDNVETILNKRVRRAQAGIRQTKSMGEIARQGERLDEAKMGLDAVSKAKSAIVNQSSVGLGRITDNLDEFATGQKYLDDALSVGGSKSGPAVRAAADRMMIDGNLVSKLQRTPLEDWPSDVKNKALQKLLKFNWD